MQTQPSISMSKSADKQTDGFSFFHCRHITMQQHYKINPLSSAIGFSLYEALLLIVVVVITTAV